MMKALTKEEAAARGFVAVTCDHCGAIVFDRYTADSAQWIRAAKGRIECLPCAKKHLEPEHLLYWGSAFERKGDDTGKVVEGFFTLLLGRRAPLLEPRHCVRRDVARADREELARALAMGTVKESYYGHASCRICGAGLGNKDLVGWGYQWPEKAEHYVLVHDVWTPACTRMLAQVRST